MRDALAVSIAVVLAFAAGTLAVSAPAKVAATVLQAQEGGAW